MLAAFNQADMARLLIVAVVAVPVLFAADAWILKLIFDRLVGHVSTRDMLTVKGASHFGQALNTGAAMATMAFLVHRRHGYGFWAGMSAFLFQMAIDTMALILLMTLGITFAGDVIPASLRAGLVPVLAVGWVASGVGVGFWLSGFAMGPFARLRRVAGLAAFDRARSRDYLAIFSARLALMISYACVDYLVVRSFGIVTPFEAQIVYTSILAFAMAVPASISGLGAVQIVMILLYGGHVLGADPEAQILAFSTAWGPLINLLRIAIAYLFLHRVSKMLSTPADDIGQRN